MRLKEITRVKPADSEDGSIISHTMGHCQNDIITVLYDQEYMVAVRERLNIIAAFKAEM